MRRRPSRSAWWAPPAGRAPRRPAGSCAAASRSRLRRRCRSRAPGPRWPAGRRRPAPRPPPRRTAPPTSGRACRTSSHRRRSRPRDACVLPDFLDEYGFMIAEGLHVRGGAAARIGRMLTEEALIVLAAFAACGLLALGVLELLWPTRPKHPDR